MYYLIVDDGVNEIGLACKIDLLGRLKDLCRNLDGEGFAKTAGIPMDLSRLFASLDPQEIGADQDKNRSIQVTIKIQDSRPTIAGNLFLYHPLYIGK